MYNCKLIPEAYELLLQMSAAGHKIPAIDAELARRGFTRPSRVRLYKIIHQQCNQKKLDLYRKKYMNSIQDVPVANKRVRLDTIQDMVSKINNTIDKIVGKNDKVNNRALKKFLALGKRLNEFLVSAREEMEKKPQFQLVQIQGAEYTMEELFGELKDTDNSLALLRARGISLPPNEAKGNSGGDTLQSSG